MSPAVRDYALLGFGARCEELLDLDREDAGDEAPTTTP